jgi:hypothetical protein
LNVYVAVTGATNVASVVVSTFEPPLLPVITNPLAVVTTDEVPGAVTVNVGRVEADAAVRFVAIEVVPQEAGLLFVNVIDGADIQFNVAGKRSVIQVPVFVATYQVVFAEITPGL